MPAGKVAQTGSLCLGQGAYLKGRLLGAGVGALRLRGKVVDISLTAAVVELPTAALLLSVVPTPVVALTGTR